MEETEKREAICLNNLGKKIFAVLHFPLNKIKAPVVLMCSGYAGNKCSKFRLSVRLSQELAKKGIASLRFDYRGTGDSEGEFEELTLQSQVSDAVCCLNYLQAHPQMQTDQIGLFGRSLGGMIAVLTTQIFSSIKSLALWSPVFNSEPWQTLWKAASLDQEKLSNLKNSSFPPFNQEFLKQFFQVDLIPSLRSLKDTPFLHIHSENDEVVSKDHLKGYKEARLGSSQSRFITLTKSTHSFCHAGEQQIAIEETVNWYIETLIS